MLSLGLKVLPLSESIGDSAKAVRNGKRVDFKRDEPQPSPSLEEVHQLRDARRGPGYPGASLERDRDLFEGATDLNPNRVSPLGDLTLGIKKSRRTRLEGGQVFATPEKWTNTHVQLALYLPMLFRHSSLDFLPPIVRISIFL